MAAGDCYSEDLRLGQADAALVVIESISEDLFLVDDGGSHVEDLGSKVGLDYFLPEDSEDEPGDCKVEAPHKQ